MKSIQSANRRKAGSRPPIERIMHIARLLRAGRPVTCNAVARKFELSPKTIERDIEFMRDRMGYRIEYMEGLHTYKLLQAPIPIL